LLTPWQQAQKVEHLRRSAFTLVLLCFLPGPPASADSYQIVTEEWAPYNYTENNQLTGMTTEVVRAIMALTGDNFELVVLPSMRSAKVLKSRPKTILYSMFRTPDREALYKWVGPIAQESIYPYQLADADPVNSRAQLMRAPQITTRIAGLIPDTLQAQGFTNLDKSATGSEQLYRMLLAGRTDIIVGDTPAGVAYYSRQLNIPPATLRRIPVELYRSSLYIAFSSDSEDKVVASWVAALQQLLNSGELERIQRRYDHLVEH